MVLSAPSITNLLDLVEIRISCFEVFDREDEREMKNLELCRAELLEMQSVVMQSSVVLDFPSMDGEHLSL